MGNILHRVLLVGLLFIPASSQADGNLCRGIVQVEMKIPSMLEVSVVEIEKGSFSLKKLIGDDSAHYFLCFSLNEPYLNYNVELQSGQEQNSDYLVELRLISGESWHKLSAEASALVLEHKGGVRYQKDCGKFGNIVVRIVPKKRKELASKENTSPETTVLIFSPSLA